jgi:hypothetical protein
LKTNIYAEYVKIQTAIPEQLEVYKNVYDTQPAGRKVTVYGHGSQKCIAGKVKSTYVNWHRPDKLHGTESFMRSSDSL